MAANELKWDELYRACDPEGLRFQTTEELEPFSEVLGQPRAMAAVAFGTSIEKVGYNLFVLGEVGTGRHAVVRRFLEEHARSATPPSDWCYVRNFKDAKRPRLLRMPSGQGESLRQDMERLVEELQTSLTAALESEDYQTQRMALDEELQEQQSTALGAMQEEAERNGLRVAPGPAGFSFVPIRDGKPLSPQQIQELPAEERARLEKVASDLQENLQKRLGRMPKLQREHRDRVRELNRRVTRYAAGSLIEDLKRTYQDLPEVVDYLEAVEQDVVEHAREFMQNAAGEPSNPLQAMLAQGQQGRSFQRRYRVNVLVDNAGETRAPIVHEDHPTHANLIGRMEHQSEFGALVTDFDLIRAGALHRANGGYLLLDAMEVLRQPYAWEGLKRALRARQVKLESLGESLGLMHTVSLEPEPVPLDMKVILIGEPRVYYLLVAHDPDFADLFKVEVDFDERMERTPENEQDYARALAGMAREEGLRAFDRDAVGRMVEQGARMVADSERLSLDIRRLRDLAREADHWAGLAEHEIVTAADVQRAIDEGIFRSDRLRQRVQEELVRGTINVSSDGEAVGQINGLSVLQLGDFAFGRPSRITARVRLGSGRVVDIEREVDLSGPLHSKGVLILSGFLGERYATDTPLSLSASLVFEQSYGGIEGDSASLAELYALLSAISGVPVRQSFAITGSVNQHGEVQAIGGVNEKIESFFDLCRARGLTGDQGVLIPRSNAVHAMLRADVVEAVRDGRFRVICLDRVDDGVEILTGLPAGTLQEDGRYSEGSFNRRVQDRLEEMAQKRKGFTALPENVSER